MTDPTGSNIWLLAISPLFVCIFMMLVAFVFAVRWNFYSLVDVVWSYSFSVVALIYASLPGGDYTRNLFLLLLVVFWSFRLGTHLALRLRAHFPKEDGRYSDLKNKWQKNLKLNFFLFYMFQGFSVVLLSIPYLLIATNPNPFGDSVEILGILVFIFAVIGEAIADSQLRGFKVDPKNKGLVCNIGLWRYSRHPNYFFEWTTWIGIALFAWTAPNGFLAIVSPLIMLYLLLKMTGIPYTEAQSIKSKGDLYKSYQQQTSMFFPWFPGN